MGLARTAAAGKAAAPQPSAPRAEKSQALRLRAGPLQAPDQVLPPAPAAAGRSRSGAALRGQDAQRDAAARAPQQLFPPAAVSVRDRFPGRILVASTGSLSRLLRRQTSLLFFVQYPHSSKTPVQILQNQLSKNSF